MGALKDLLQDALAQIEAGIAAEEDLDAYDAYRVYAGAKRERSPHFARAQDLLTEADAIDTSGRSHALRGWWYQELELRRPPTTRRESWKAWKKAVAQRPTYAPWLTHASCAALRAGSRTDGLKLLNKLVKADKEDAHPYYLRACVHADMLHAERAVKEASKAIARDPDDPRFYEVLAPMEAYPNDPSPELLARARRLREAARFEPWASQGMLDRLAHVRRTTEEGSMRVYCDQTGRWYDRFARRVR